MQHTHPKRPKKRKCRTETSEKFQANVEPISLSAALYHYKEVFLIIKFYKEAWKTPNLKFFASFMSLHHLCWGRRRAMILYFWQCSEPPRSWGYELQYIFEIKRLPKYSAFHSMVENAISCWKSAKKAKPGWTNGCISKSYWIRCWRPVSSTVPIWHLRSIIEATACEITNTKCIGWYNHTLSYIPRCLARDDVEGPRHSNWIYNVQIDLTYVGFYSLCSKWISEIQIDFTFQLNFKLNALFFNFNCSKLKI